MGQKSSRAASLKPELSKTTICRNAIFWANSNGDRPQRKSESQISVPAAERKSSFFLF